MAQSSPYYRSEEEKQALIRLRDSFGERFEAPAPRNLTIVIAAEQGLGKTHLMCTLAEDPQYGPVYIGDTEHRAQIVVEKFTGRGVPIKRATITSYPELVAFVKWAKKSLKPPFIIGLDSLSDLDKFAEEQYLLHENKEFVGKPIQHPRMQRYIYALLDELKFSGATIVATAKMKDEFVGENRTGRVLPRVFKDVPYRADLTVLLYRDGRRMVDKSGWTRVGNTGSPVAIPDSVQTLSAIIEFAKSLDTLPEVAPVPAESLLAVVGGNGNGGRRIMGRR
jgi:hypothetical protein